MPGVFLPAFRGSPGGSPAASQTGSGRAAFAGSPPARHRPPSQHGRSAPGCAVRRPPSWSNPRRTTSSACARRSVRFAPSNVSDRFWRPVPSLPLRPAGSLRPFGLGIPALAALSPPLQRSLRFLRHPLPPPPSPSLRSEYRRLAAMGRVGLTLLSNVEKRMGRLRPIVRRVLVPPSSRLPIDDPTRVPFWRRPVSTFGRLPMTDLDNGRSLAFSLPSSAGPPPDWCFQIVAVVP